jgi:uncharacterized phage protein (TIGR01671 family)
MEDRYLFKAKHIHVLPNNNHLDGSWVVGFLSGERYIANDSGEYLIDPSTICQCTGLKDKNGKLIWENDIIRCKVGTAKVIWNKLEWRIEWLKNNLWRKDLYYWAVEDIQRTVVIGNIFDNPELVESEEN